MEREVVKTKGKGGKAVPICTWTIIDFPDDPKEALHWAVDEGILTLADLDVAIRPKMNEGDNREITWEEVQQKLLGKASPMKKSIDKLIEAYRKGSVDQGVFLKALKEPDFMQTLFDEDGNLKKSKLKSSVQKNY